MSKPNHTKKFLKLSGWLIPLVALLFMFHWFERANIYFPSRQIAATPADWGWKFEDIYFTASDGTRLNGWFLPSRPGSANSQLVILFFHGNAGNISHRSGLYEVLLAAGVNVFAIDYRGYGRSQGRVEERGTYLDAEAAHAWLVQRGFQPTNIIAMGESLGCAIAVELATRHTLGGLILQSGFTSIADLGAEIFPWLPVRWMNTIKYDTCCKLPRIQAPILIMHSPADTLVRIHHGRKNFAAAPEPKLFCEIEGNHNDSLLTPGSRAQYLAALEKFLAMRGKTMRTNK